MKNLCRYSALMMVILFLTACSEVSETPSLFEEEQKQSEEKSEESDVISSDIMVPYGSRIESISDKGIEVYWKHPEVTDGYEVWRSYDEDGAYQKIAQLDDFNEWSWYDTDFDESKKAVFYKVRNYVYDDKGQIVYSNFTQILTASYRENIKLNHKKLYLASGYNQKLEAYYGWKTLHDVKWSSSDENVATINDAGIVAGVGKGKCKLTCSSKMAGDTKEVTVIVDREAPSMLQEYNSRFHEVGANVWENPEAEKSGEALIMVVGDMLCMAPQQKEYHIDGEYDFNSSYEYVKPIFEQADYVIGNLEAIVDSCSPYGINESKVNGKPNCNAPSRLLDALKYAGIDAVYTANNHNADGGVHGVLETCNQLERYELGATGILDGPDDTRTMIAIVNGIRIGMVSYTTTVNGHDKNWDKNDVDTYLNFYSKDKAEADIKQLKEQGAEFIIVFIHWGKKNNLNYNNKQVSIAQELADIGVDYIAGSHPHVVQAFENIEASDGRIVPCIYSLGDFNSPVNQVSGNLEGVILRLRLKRNDEKILIDEQNYIPCYSYREFKGKGYVTIPLNTSITGLAKTDRYDEYRNQIAEIIGDKLQEYKGE